MSGTSKLPVILVHGMWGGPHQWKHWKPFFEEQGHEVNALTLMEHGKGKNPSKLSVLAYALQVGKVVRDTGPCILIGHSMGGLIVQKVAGVDPMSSMVKRMVLVTSAAPKGIRAFTPQIFWTMRRIRYLKAMLFSGAAFELYDKDARALMMNGLSSQYCPKNVFTSAESGQAAYELAFNCIGVEDLKDYDCPSLVIAGTRDRMTPLRIQTAIAAKHGSEISVYDCGHLPMIEPGREQVVKQILKWFDLIDIREGIGYRASA